MKNLYFTESASPARLAAVFNRLRSTEPVSYGIHFLKSGVQLIPMSEQFLHDQKIMREGFIIGVLVERLLHPIYDINRRPVVVRISDMLNIPLV